MSDKKMDMLNGSLWDKILIFAIPLALTGILQQVFNATDVAIVGQYVGKQAMAAVGCNAPVVALVVNLFMGVAIGVNVTIAGFIGINDKEGIGRAVHTACITVVLLSIAVAGVAIALAPWILNLLSVPDDVFEATKTYFMIIIGGLPLMAVYNCESAVFSSHGDTRTPLLCLTIAGFINVFLNLFFILVLNMDVEGVAIATTISNACSAGLLFFFLCRSSHEEFRISMRKLTIDPAILRKILRLGLPAGMQGMVFSLSNICIQSGINSLGADFMAASAAALYIEILVFFLLNSFGQAATTFIGQNYAVGNYERCFAVTRICLYQNMGLTLFLSAILLVFARFFLGFFNSDPVILDIGQMRLWFILIPEGVNVLLEVMSGSLRGYGRSLTPAMISLVGICGVRIVWVTTVFQSYHDFPVIMACYPISWVITTTVIIAAYFRFKRRLLVSVKNKYSAGTV